MGVGVKRRPQSPIRTRPHLKKMGISVVWGKEKARTTPFKQQKQNGGYNFHGANYKKQIGAQKKGN